MRTYTDIPELRCDLICLWEVWDWTQWPQFCVDEGGNLRSSKPHVFKTSLKLCKTVLSRFMDKKQNNENVFLLLNNASPGLNYKEKLIGPSTEPCGTPWLPQLHLLTNMSKLVFDKYASKSALRSSRTRIETSPWFEALRRSFMTLTSAVSVLRWALNSYWNISNKLLFYRSCNNWVTTTFSRPSDIKVRWGGGLQLAHISASRDGSESASLIAAYLRKAHRESFSVQGRHGFRAQWVCVNFASCLRKAFSGATRWSVG